MTSKILTCFTLGLTLSFHPAFAADIKSKPPGNAAPMMSVDTQSFVKTAASSNEFEIQSSELALQSANDADVKKAASMIIADHKKAGEKLKSLLQKDAKPQAPSVEFAPKQTKMLEQLKAVKGRDFDSLYLDIQAQAHIEAVALFRTYAGSGEDQRLVGFAKETLPTLETHMSHIKMLIAER
jgi:putative membrane protein